MEREKEKKRKKVQKRLSLSFSPLLFLFFPLISNTLFVRLSKKEKKRKPTSPKTCKSQEPTHRPNKEKTQGKEVFRIIRSFVKGKGFLHYQPTGLPSPSIHRFPSFLPAIPPVPECISHLRPHRPIYPVPGERSKNESWERNHNEASTGEILYWLNSVSTEYRS